MCDLPCARGLARVCQNDRSICGLKTFSIKGPAPTASHGLCHGGVRRVVAVTLRRGSLMMVVERQRGLPRDWCGGSHTFSLGCFLLVGRVLRHPVAERWPLRRPGWRPLEVRSLFLVAEGELCEMELSVSSVASLCRWALSSWRWLSCLACLILRQEEEPMEVVLDLASGTWLGECRRVLGLRGDPRCCCGGCDVGRRELGPRGVPRQGAGPRPQRACRIGVAKPVRGQLDGNPGRRPDDRPGGGLPGATC